MKAEILVNNIRCGECAEAIKKGLQQFAELSEVNVDIKKSLISINYSEGVSMEKIKNKLSDMGYPARNTLSGFDKLTGDARSFLGIEKNKIIKES